MQPVSYLQEMDTNGKKETMKGNTYINAQGEDVVAGVRTGNDYINSSKTDMPKSYKELD